MPARMHAHPRNPKASARTVLLSIVLAVAMALALGGCSRAIQGAPESWGIVAEQGWWIDHGGQADLAEVRKVTHWTPFSGLTTFGIGYEPIWFRFRLAAGTEDTPPLWILRVLPAYLDELTFHDPGAGRSLRAGRSVPPKGEMISSINFSFPVPSMQEGRDIYVRLDSATTRLVLIDLLPYGDAAYRNRLHEWLFAALIALSAMSVLWAVSEWVISREGVVGMFALKQCIATVWCLLAAGFARILVGPILPEGMLSALQSMLLPWTIAAGIGFVMALLKSYGLRRFWTLLLVGLVVAFALVPLLLLVDMVREIRLITNFSLPPVFVCLFLALASVSRQKGDLPVPRTMLSVYLVAYGLLLSVPAMINLGGLDLLMASSQPTPTTAVSVTTPISPSELLAVYASLFSLMLDGLVMRILLMRRAHDRRLAQRTTELRMQRIEEDAKARERLNVEQSRLFTMLAHEMKTPLATLRMWVHAGSAGHSAMNRAILDMNLIIERCVHTGQLAEQGLQPISEQGDACQQTWAAIETSRAPDRFEFSGPEGPATLVADMQMLSIVLVNLFDNAAKYSAPKTSITVSLQAQERERRNGWSWRIGNIPGPAGMPDPGRLFEKYYRSAGARQQSGSGLGLFLVRGLLELMGGVIQFEQDDGRALFEVWIPAEPTMR